ncbi:MULTISPECIES: SPOR domain-containing protein [unclassified Helicobacter]|uniref:SPOR domain-containing protein n=1 Tax=unclassified Helicobacter TaxID=2593540 RepID=UPI000CF1888A|nr:MULTISPECIES: SPOR domain-containing protein [unclassified Helicobacter]
MEEKDFNELLFEEKKNPKNVKNVIIGAIGIVVVLTIALLVWSFTKNSHNNIIEQTQNTQTEHIADEFQDSSKDLSDNFNSDDRFEQILQDVRQEAKNANQHPSLDQDLLQNHQNHISQAPSDQELASPSQDSVDNQLQAALDLKDEPKEIMMHHEEMDKKPIQVEKKAVEHKPQKQHKVQKKAAAKSGSVATKGSYLQVGVFSKQPSKELLNMLKKHSYRTQEIIINDQKLTKYLVGPFKSRSEASRYKESHSELKHSVYFEIK